jgi:hypothetical protein
VVDGWLTIRCASRVNNRCLQHSTSPRLPVPSAYSKHPIQNMDHLHTINHPSRLHDVRFCKRVIGKGEVLLVAAEDKKVTIYDISNEPEAIPTIIAVMVGHSNRSVFPCLDARRLNCSSTE